MLTGGIA
jgi:hypothetical protein